MDKIIGLFQSLDGDQTILYQFAIVVVLFYLTKFLFLDHLQRILEAREDRTVNLEGDTEKKFDEINKIQSEYKEKIQKANKEIKVKLEENKNNIIKREESVYREQEKEINSFIESSRSEITKDIESKKDKILQEAEDLAKSLVQKMSKE